MSGVDHSRPAEEVRDLALAVREALLTALAAWSDRDASELGLATEALAVTRPPKPEMGDLAMGCFPLAKLLRKAPAQIASELVPAAEKALAESALPRARRVASVGPYLNIHFEPAALAAYACRLVAAAAPPYGTALPATGQRIMVEYSAPNTNKPLHLGHVRNNLLGLSLCNILAATGEEVIPVNLVNDRGIHIAKSMVAYRRWGAGQTPAEAACKGDHFVGRFYVRFSQALEEEQAVLAREAGYDPAALDADTRRALEDQTPLMAEARDVLRLWEAADPDIHMLWKRMNSWVYAGFDETYRRLGCAFRKWYFESQTYRRGKRLVEEGLAKGLFERRGDDSVWAPLAEKGLKDKILLRADGTSVYITQDLGTAVLKHDDFAMDRSLYVVGSEQNLHFKLLFLLLEKLGFSWATGCRHVSYGLITLPRGMGKLKSREGRAVDADDLLDELATIARQKARDGGYVSGSDRDLAALGDMIGQGALKMYLLQVSAEKNIQFDPDATLDFEGDTGPAVQYSHARICSIARKALAAGRIAAGDLVVWDLPQPFAALGTQAPGAPPPPAAGAQREEETARAAGLREECADTALLTSEEEHRLALELAMFPNALKTAAAQLSPSPVAAYALELTKAYARFYHNCPVLKAQTNELTRARLHLSLAVAATLRRALALLGIEAPDAM